MSYNRVLEQIKRDRASIRRVLDRMSDAAIEDVVRRGQHRKADGLPGSTRASDASRSTGEYTSTERAALRLASPAPNDEHAEAEPDTWHDTEQDHIADALNAFVTDLGLARGNMLDAEKAWDFVEYVGAKARGRCPTCDATGPAGEGPDRCLDIWHLAHGGDGQCNACHRPVSGAEGDQLKSGYCPPCLAAWVDAGRPDRGEFNATRVICAECDLTVFTWETETLDSRSYHRREAGTGCYWRAYNRSRGRRGA